MKKIITIILLIVLLTQVAFGTDIQLFVNDVNITESSSPIIRNDRLLVPVKFVSEELGGKFLGTV